MSESPDIRPNGDEIRAAEAAFMDEWSEQGFGDAPRDDQGCRIHPFRCTQAALTAAFNCPDGTLSGLREERDAYRDALGEIYRDVGVGGIGPMIAAKALKKGVWAESAAALAPREDERA